MKTKILYLYFVLSCSPLIVFSQSEEKNYTKAESISTKVMAENPLLHNARDNAIIGSEKTNGIWSLKPLSIGTTHFTADCDVVGPNNNIFTTPVKGPVQCTWTYDLIIEE